ncbi:MarR family transcriptional regulator [Aurantiacibacter xanthus]|uniref:MarR family transcriptional regulator n=1 Tax=Aurantiacibacter xanthus TaxID=1784712 RepID=A0A3A1P1K8_9SPHN|nr:MarR family winged helix-turn-helix transcriptional regulator [Aurantiacibacter xanthus]RIV82594.1 MarR family transcriptional regulator [Aurantiacibacter xanthus]
MTASPPLPGSQEELETYLPYLVNRLANLGQPVQNRLLAQSGANLVSLRALSILHIEDGLTINEIAARTFMEQSTTSRAIDAMVAQGLVERRMPDHDQRRREIMLLPAGRERLQQGWPSMAAYFEALCDGMDAKERTLVRKALIKMLANLDRMRSAPV